MRNPIHTLLGMAIVATLSLVLGGVNTVFAQEVQTIRYTAYSIDVHVHAKRAEGYGSDLFEPLPASTAPGSTKAAAFVRITIITPTSAKGDMATMSIELGEVCEIADEVDESVKCEIRGLRIPSGAAEITASVFGSDTDTKPLIVTEFRMRGEIEPTSVTANFSD